MTYTFALILFGAVSFTAGVKNRSFRDILQGVTSSVPGPGEHGFLTALLPDIRGASQSVGGAVSAGATGTAGIHAKGVGTFDGHKVAKWIIPWLEKARASGLWKGSVTSGYRTPAESRALCMRPPPAGCGAPSCPGTCAGTSSNHSGSSYPNGAVDVSDPAGFAAAMRKVHGPLRNALPNDPVHYSVTGR